VLSALGPKLLTENAESGAFLVKETAHGVLGCLIGLGNGGHVGLRLDHEVPRSESGSGHLIGEIGRCQSQLQLCRGIHGAMLARGAGCRKAAAQGSRRSSPRLAFVLPPRVWLTTLGCAKNQVDSDKIAARLATAGFATAGAPEDAEVILVNTCAFIEAARKESVEAILDAAERAAGNARLVVLGCLAQRLPDELAAALPEVDAVIGIDRYGDLVGRLGDLTGWRLGSPLSAVDILDEELRLAPSSHYAYVKVAEGCDKPCTFCAIPQFRGPQRSRQTPGIRAEVAALVSAGVSEVVLVAQDTAAYGRDLGLTDGPTRLLRALSDVEGLRRLRLLYLHPREIGEGLIEEMTGNPLVAPYFDLSLQHSAGRLLRAMKRPGDGGEHLDLIGRIRSAAPEAALRSSFIVGFPGETDGDVDRLGAFLGEAGLDWAGFFPFSAEDGTPAAEMPEQVPPEEAAERVRYLVSLQEEITGGCSARRVGSSVEVLVDGVEDGVPVGRSHREAPEIDGMILLDRGRPGQWVTARITGSYGADTAAEVVG
jgi:ribosomal protein S12 methylthiotransferase